MPRRDLSGTSTDSHDPESSRTSSECSSQPLSPTSNKAMNDAFAALDDSMVDSGEFALRRSSEEILEAPRISTFSRDSLSVHTFASSRWGSSDAMSKVYTYSPLFEPESEEIQGSFALENDASTSKSDHENLQQQVKDWLRLLPSPTRVESRCVEPLQHNTERPDPTGAAARTGSNNGGQRNSTTTRRPEMRRFLHHMDLFNDCDCDNHVARSLTKGCSDNGKDGLFIDECEPHTHKDLREILDDYHTALLQIQFHSRPTDFCTLRYRPSLRRQYPRGLEEEAHQSIELIILRGMASNII
ncbi:hypothetical protein FHETE_2562 [Fusarium heterosporum]|uniref:Uncharacterized protein n=1 Tax=Fusarium heterosporum TaxID=42747 RepID=A0A8H5TVQ9_FUSHE|nr:hypothetical protein FHETE_2562 [Fusarium heterosporum]